MDSGCRRRYSRLGGIWTAVGSQGYDQLRRARKMRLSNVSVALRAVFVAWAASSLGCGGDDATSEIRGPRLEWDQQAESPEQARSLSFRLYVDDIGRALSGAACRATTNSGYVCAAPLPQLGSGRHVLQLASVLNGLESLRSEPLEVSGTQGQSSIAQEPDTPISPVPSTACMTGPATECYAVREVAFGLFGIND